MTKPSIKIEFEHGKECYFPGDIVHTTISLHSDKHISLRGVYAQLLGPEWDGVKRLIGDKIDISSGTSQTYNLDFLIPLYPKPDISLETRQKSGEIKHIAFGSPWKIEVRDRGNELLAVECFSLIVPPPGIFSDTMECKCVAIGSHEPGKNPYNALAKADNLRLVLPRLEWVEGETIEGRLILKPSKDSAIKGLKIKLSRTANQYLSNSGIRFAQAEANDIEVVLFDGERQFHAGDETVYTFALPIQKRGWPTRFTNLDYVENKIVVTIGGGFFGTNTINYLVYIYNGKGSRITEHIPPGTSDALLADERVFQFYKNTANEWYSGESPVFTAMSFGAYNLGCALPVAMLGDEFLRNFHPLQIPLGKFFAQARPETDEYLILNSFSKDFGGYVLTNHRLLLISPSQNTKECNIKDILSIETKKFPPKSTVKMKNGDVLEERVIIPGDIMKMILSVRNDAA